jgi:hypothetical protein
MRSRRVLRRPHSTPRKRGFLQVGRPFPDCCGQTSVGRVCNPPALARHLWGGFATRRPPRLQRRTAAAIATSSRSSRLPSPAAPTECTTTAKSTLRYSAQPRRGDRMEPEASAPGKASLHQSPPRGGAGPPQAPRRPPRVPSGRRKSEYPAENLSVASRSCHLRHRRPERCILSPFGVRCTAKAGGQRRS